MSQPGHSESFSSPVFHTRLLLIGFLLGLPPLIFWLFNLRPTHQMDTLDPYFYTGYINNARDLLLRLDLPYYAVRFGLILPGRFLTWALGAIPGYLAYRYLLALTAGIPLYFLVRRIFSTPVATITYVALIASPWFQRTILWDHPDASGVPYLIAAMCAVLIDRQPSRWRDAMAGAWASMAVNSNVFTGVIFGIFAAVYIVLSLAYGTPWRTLLQRAIGFAAGFLVILAAGYGYYWYVFGKPRNIFLPTFNTINHLRYGGMKEFRTPGYAWLYHATNVHVPILISLCCLILAVRRSMRFESAVCAATGPAVIAFFFVHQFLMNGDTLQLFYYFSYALPATFLMVACIWQELWTRYSGRAAAFAALAIASTLAPILLVCASVSWLDRFTTRLSPPAIAVTLVVVCLARFHWPTPALRSALSLAALPVLALAFYCGATTPYSIARPFTVRDDSGIDQYRVAVQLIEESPKLSDGPGNLLFWYNDRAANPINAVQSVYLWGYTKMNPNGDIGMPHVGEFQMGQLRTPAVRYIALLGETPGEVEQGLQALRNAGAGFGVLSTRDLHSGAFHVYWQLIELTQRPPNPAAVQ